MTPPVPSSASTTASESIITQAAPALAVSSVASTSAAPATLAAPLPQQTVAQASLIRQAIAPNYWDNFDNSLNEQEFLSLFCEFLVSDLSLSSHALLIDESTITDSHERLKLLQKIFFYKEIQHKAKLVFSFAEKILRSKETLKKPMHSREAHNLRSQIMREKNKIASIFIHIFECFKEYKDSLIRQEALSENALQLKIEEVRKTIENKTKLISSVANNFQFLDTNTNTIGMLLNELSGQEHFLLSSLDELLNQTESSVLLALIKDKLEKKDKSSIDPEDISNFLYKLPKRFYVAKFAMLQKQVRSAKHNLLERTADLMDKERAHQANPKTTTKNNVIKSKLLLHDSLKRFAKEALELKLFENILNTPQENQYFLPSWDSSSAMSNWVQHVRDWIARASKRIEDDNAGLGSLFDDLRITENQVVQRLDELMSTEAEQILKPITTNTKYRYALTSSDVTVYVASQPSSKELNAEGKQALRNILSIITGEQGLSVFDMSFVSQYDNNYPETYYAARLLIAGWESVKSLASLKLSILALLQAKKRGLSSRSLNLSIAFRLKESIQKLITKHTFEKIFAQSEENQTPLGLPELSMMRLGESANETYQKLKDECSKISQQYDTLLQSENFTDDEIKGLLTTSQGQRKIEKELLCHSLYAQIPSLDTSVQQSKIILEQAISPQSAIVPKFSFRFLDEQATSSISTPATSAASLTRQDSHGSSASSPAYLTDEQILAIIEHNNLDLDALDEPTTSSQAMPQQDLPDPTADQDLLGFEDVFDLDEDEILSVIHSASASVDEETLEMQQAILSTLTSVDEAQPETSASAKRSADASSAAEPSAAKKPRPSSPIRFSPTDDSADKES